MVILSLICLIAGTAISGLAPNRPAQQALLETAGGSLIVLGLGIVGVYLPLFR